MKTTLAGMACFALDAGNLQTAGREGHTPQILEPSLICFLRAFRAPWCAFINMHDAGKLDKQLFTCIVAGTALATAMLPELGQN